MRLNFAGVPDAEIREAVRRIGRAMSGQAGLFGILTGSSTGASTQASERADAAPEEPADAGEDGARLADVVELPRRAEPGRAGEQGDR